MSSFWGPLHYVIEKNRLRKLCAVDNPQNRCLFNERQKVLYFVHNGSVVALDKVGIPRIVFRKLPGNVRLFKHFETINLLSNGGIDGVSNRPLKLILNIDKHPQELSFNYPPGCAVDACKIDDENMVIGGSCGLRLYENQCEKWKLDFGNIASVKCFKNRIYFFVNGTILKSVNLDGRELQTLIEFALPGSVGDFDLVNENEFYFHLCYSENNKAKTCVVNIIL